MEVNKAKDGTEWIDLLCGGYLGRMPDGKVRLCWTNGLPPWDPQSGATFVELQRDRFGNAAAFGLGADVARDDSPIIIGQETAKEIVAMRAELVRYRAVVAEELCYTGTVVDLLPALQSALQRLRSYDAARPQPCAGGHWETGPKDSGLEMVAVCSICKRQAGAHQ